MAQPLKHKVIFRDDFGRFMKQADRYTPRVAMIQAWRGGQYEDIAYRPLPPQDLANLLTQREFEALPEALRPIKTYTSKSKYKAWDIAEQIDQTKGIRRKDIKYTIAIEDAGRLREIEFYHRVKRNTESSYALFQRINQELGLEGMFLYDRVGSKIFADRKGKKVRLISIKAEEII